MKVDHLARLEQLAGEPSFWDDSTKAQATMREMTRLRNQVSVWQGLESRIGESLELIELDDEELRQELLQEVADLSVKVADLEFQTLFSDKFDEEEAILAIHAGAGGTEAQDWAQMLQRMFIRWARTHDFVVDIMDESRGDEAGLKSCLMSVKGKYVYGRLKSERGVHRLVRFYHTASSRICTLSFDDAHPWPDVDKDSGTEEAVAT